MDKLSKNQRAFVENKRAPFDPKGATALDWMIQIIDQLAPCPPDYDPNDMSPTDHGDENMEVPLL